MSIFPAMGVPGAQSQGGFELTARQFGGGFDMRYDWRVHIVGSEIRSERTGQRLRVRQLSSSQQNALRHWLDESLLFDLQGNYGCAHCSDNPVCTLEVVTAGRRKQVQVFLSVDSAELKPGIRESADVERFMSVWRAIKRVAGLDNVKDVCL